MAIGDNVISWKTQEYMTTESSITEDVLLRAYGRQESDYHPENVRRRWEESGSRKERVEGVTMPAIVRKGVFNGEKSEESEFPGLF